MQRFRNDIAAFTIALTLAGCAPALSDPHSSALPSARTPVQLNDSAITLLAGLLRMEDRRALTPALVQEGLRHAEPEVRRRAALAAGRTGDRVSSTWLRETLANDAHERVGADAAFALGELGDTSAATTASLRAAMMRPGGGERAQEAAHALGKIISPASYAALAEALSAPMALRNAVLAEALLAIWHHPRESRTPSLVLPHMTSRDPRVRFSATYALMRAGRAAAVPALLHAMRDSDPLVRETAARGLRPALVDSAGVRDSARVLLTNALTDVNPGVRINAVRALGNLRDTQSVPAIEALLRDSIGNVAISAVSALVDHRGPGSDFLLMAVAQSPQYPLSVRATALAGLGRSGTYSQSGAREWVRSSDWLQRVYGIRALAASPYASVAADLRALTRDPDPRVEAEALGAIAAADTADTTHALDALYVESLASSDALVRATAIGALGRHRDRAYVSAFMDAYERARTDRENDAALAAVDALGALARTDSAVARAFFFRFARSTDPVVRAAVARSLGAGSWGPPGWPADRPLAFYEGVVRTRVAPILAGGARPRAIIHSTSGDITVELAADEAPLTVESFVTLATGGFFSSPGARWHRVVPNFVLQDGDPRGDGSGGPGYSIRDEMNRLRYTKGALGMALSGPDTGGSQFFITYSPQPHLDGGYAVFGYVVSGMAAADRVVQDESIRGIDIIK